jgi:hypothetical protein
MGSILLIATVVLALVLGLVNFYYSYQAKKMLEKKVEETEIELMMASRPLLVARAVVHEGPTTYEDDTLSAPKGTPMSDNRPSAAHFSHFELYNAGNSPALGLEISLMNEEKVVLQSESLGFLRNNELALSFIPIKLETKTTYYLVSEYESVRSRVRKIWYQTWLQFTTVGGVAKNTINVNVGVLDFKEVSHIERIDAFMTKGKAD